MVEKTRWEKACLSLDATIEVAINVLNDTSLRIVLVIDSNEILIGTISDGDIRRALISGLQLASSVSNIVNRNPVIVSEQDSKPEVIRLMSEKKVQQIPIVDKRNKLIGLHIWDDLILTPKRTNPFVIMAGGKGTRLMPKTKDTPKPMLKIGGKPILEHIILRAKTEGFRTFYLAVHHLSGVIEEYFKDGSFLDIDINYLREKSPLGTAGALSLLNQIPIEPVIITNGDVLTDVRFGALLDFHKQTRSSATMAVQIYESQIPFGVVKTRDIEIVKYQEKPIDKSLINAGVYVLGTEMFRFIKKQELLDMPSLFESAMKNGLKTSAFLIHENWVDLGSHYDYEIAERKFSTKLVD